MAPTRAHGVHHVRTGGQRAHGELHGVVRQRVHRHHHGTAVGGMPTLAVMDTRPLSRRIWGVRVNCSMSFWKKYAPMLRYSGSTRL